MSSQQQQQQQQASTTSDPPAVAPPADSPVSVTVDSPLEDDAGYATAQEAVEATPPSPDGDFNKKRLLEYCIHFDESEARSFFSKHLSVHPHMIELILKLRQICYGKHPRIPIQIILIVSMMETIVAFARGKIENSDLEQYMPFIREQWKLVGDYINLGEAQSDKKVLHLLAFCVSECIAYKDDTDKMDPTNHTLKYSDCNIFRDYLRAAGYACTKKESQQIALENIAKTDGWIEAGLVGKGNVWSQYEDQLDARFAEFCEVFKVELLIRDGPSKIEKKTYTHYRGVHIVAAAGLLNVGLRALLTYVKSQGRLSVLVESTRVRDLFFERGGHQFDVIQKKAIRIYPFIHPNRHERFLTNYSDEEIGKLDKSYSLAHRALDGIEIMVGSSTETFRATSSTGNLQRFTLRKEAQQVGINQEDAANLREINDLDRTAKRNQKFQQNKNRRMKKN
eukprot:scaffold8671_cov112-Skeletonema_dohrnii-CCMP3373.AAC.15